jgi:hypothetical protein
VIENGWFLWMKKCGFVSENEKEKRRVKELLKVKRVLESTIQLFLIDKLSTLFLLLWMHLTHKQQRNENNVYTHYKSITSKLMFLSVLENKYIFLTKKLKYC